MASRLLASVARCGLPKGTMVPVYGLPLHRLPLHAVLPARVSTRLFSMGDASSFFVAAGAESINLPRAKIEATFSRSSGAGGQNVNKVNTKATLRFNVVTADWMDDHTKKRLRALFASSMTKEGELLVTSQRHRTQEANLEDAFEKLEEMVLEAAQIPAERNMRTGLTEHAKENRRDEKRHRSEVKARRNGRNDD